MNGKISTKTFQDSFAVVFTDKYLGETVIPMGEILPWDDIHTVIETVSENTKEIGRMRREIRRLNKMLRITV